ncbi:type IV secretion protein Rhs [Pseudomonas fluorescens HK44]|uniref:Type IV secretion protein Rhs n=1 Tax=Pseudomonas fluorescens HK44 TaxID=1042209 RepID=A0A010T3F1_PSEFL|nr:RHS repeat-associated core domain-containing protein [Pseudomonas fluorescens]EXF92127.1 type IV secretion protein Rhs [Pseudomonas fluorescens HK44]
MPTNRETLLCRYRYDPLDRLTACAPSVQTSTQRFYLKDRLATEIQGAVQHSIMQHEDQLLAQQRRESRTVETRLLATDQQRSVLNALDAMPPHAIVYTPYGHRPPVNGLLSLLGFNGERPDPVTGHYLLGNGYRAFNPVLMRFNSPDSLSPFARGGINPYAYCSGDPLNRRDPTGHFSFFPKGYNPIKGLKNMLGIRKPSSLKKEPLPDGTKSLVGYHGTSETSARNILNNGVQEGHIGKNTSNFGDGFYVSDTLDVAQGYARDHLRNNHRAVVLKVYVQDIQQKTMGVDYAVGTGGHEGEIVFFPSTYNDLSFKRDGSFRRDERGTYRQTLNKEIRSTTNDPTR